MVNRKLAPLFVAASLVLAVAANQSASAQAPSGPLARVVSIVVQSVDIEDDQLIATAEVVLDVAGREVTRVIEFPLNLTSTPDEDGVCPILHLSLGPIDLDLLGLVVELDDCEGGPVTIDIDAEAGEGLLGDLLCAVAGLLDGGDLGLVLASLTDLQQDLLTDTLASVLNVVLDRIVNADEALAAASHDGGSGGGRHCDILTLELPEGITLELLGLVVDTSGICLDVYAERGRGNLLGNLLCNVTGLLDRGNRGNAVRTLLRQVGRVLSRL